MSITLTELAANKVKSMLTSEAYPETAGLAFNVIGGGCAGFSYDLALKKIADETDLTFMSFGVNIFISKQSYLYLAGTEIDYKEDPFQAGFSFKNPMAKSHCGCNKSFDG